MKTTTTIFCGAALLLFGVVACKDNNTSKVLDLATGEEILLVEDDKGQLVDRETGKPVLLYVDRREGDTIYAPTRRVANGRLQKVSNGVYWYDDGDKRVKIDGDEYKFEDGDVKIKRDLNGTESKYKDDDVKVKRDGDGYKIKGDGYTKKVDADGDVKIETKDKKYKIDGETGERKVKERSVLGKLKDKVTGQ